MTPSPEPGSRDEREAEVVRQWLRPGSQVPEGRCPATECWYTLPLNAQGLIVQHSQSGTLSTCEGGGRPPRPAAVAAQPIGDGEADDVDWGAHRGSCRIFYAERRCTCQRPAPSVTPDSDQVRDEIAQTVFAMDRRGLHVNKLWSEIDGRQRGPYLRTADALLSGPVGRLLAERDRDRAEIERLVHLGWEAMRERDEAQARARLAWDVHAEHVERMNTLILQVKAERDEARTERDRYATQVQRVEEMATDLHTDARSMWAAAQTHDSETDEVVGDNYYEVSQRLRKALSAPAAEDGERRG